MGRSNHEIILIEIDTRRNSKQQVPTRSWSKADWGAMQNHLEMMDWHEEIGNLSAEQAWLKFKSKIDNLVEEHVPLRPPNNRANRPPWLSPDLLRQIRFKRRLWSKYKRSPTVENLEAYKKVEKETGKRLKNAKKQVEKRVANSEDKKYFYSYIKTKTKNRAGVGPIIIDGETLVESDQMAEALNKYFASVFQEEQAGPSPKPTNISGRRKCSAVWFQPSQVKEKIGKLKTRSAPGPDGITPELLQKLVDHVATPLSMIFTKSMREGTVPEDWRTANVTPIHKKGPRTDPGNYRPVSLTSVPGKLMEAIVKDVMQKHLSTGKLIR